MGIARKDCRVDIEADVVMRRATQNKYRVVLCNLSPSGCCIEFVDRPCLDERVWMKIDGLDALLGQVCWVNGPRAGVEFERRIHEAVFAHLLGRLRPDR